MECDGENEKWKIKNENYRVRPGRTNPNQDLSRFAGHLNFNLWFFNFNFSESRAHMSHFTAMWKRKFGYMLEKPSIFRYLEVKPPSENFEVRSISRKLCMTNDGSSPRTTYSVRNKYRSRPICGARKCSKDMPGLRLEQGYFHPGLLKSPAHCSLYKGSSETKRQTPPYRRVKI